MGADKTLIPIDGLPCAERVARAAAAVAMPCIEVGPGHTSLTPVPEKSPRRGPLAAAAAGWQALQRDGYVGPVLVLAGDLPLVSPLLLRWLADQPGEGSVVPIVAGRRQPLLARWSSWDLDAAAAAVTSGARAVGSRPSGHGARAVIPADWSSVAGAEAFTDIDDPGDLLRVMQICSNVAKGDRHGR